MKVKIINKNTNQQFDCEEIEIDGYKYYIDYSQLIEADKWYISNQAPKLCVKIKEGQYPYIYLNSKGEEIADFYMGKGVIICCNNPKIDIPKVVDEVEEFAKEATNSQLIRIFGFESKEEILDDIQKRKFYFTKGYNKSQETHPFSEKDMVEFVRFVSTNMLKHSDENGIYLGIKKVLQLWKKQKVKIIYYE